ncbi:hypothetical protein O9993_05655 [Vibrio lentus]|nr:hypothetical protein [Vibrio lentus]
MFSSVVSVMLLPLARGAANAVMVMVFSRLAHACVVVGRGVCERCVSILATGRSSSRCLGERVAAVIVERQAAASRFARIQPAGSFLPYRPHQWPLARCRSGTVFSSVVQVASLPLARRLLPVIVVMVFGSLTPVSLSVAVYVKVTSLS